MDRLTYRQAYDKIIEAYFKDEINPFDARSCFCGTLCNGSGHWCIDLWFENYNDLGNYTGNEFMEMERALMGSIMNIGVRVPEYEDALFKGMADALEVLRQIHIERGENVDEDIPAFTKRELQKVL